MSLDERMEVPPPDFAAHCRSAPVVDLHGVTGEGCSVLVHVHGFCPYFYARPPAGATADCCRKALDGLRPGEQVVSALDEVVKMPLMPYHEQAEGMLCIHVTSPKLVSMCRTALERGLKLSNGAVWQAPVYEANVPYGLRFLVDRGVGGGSWIDVSSGRFKLREARARAGTAQIELDTHWSAVAGRRAEGRWLGLAPLRVLALHFKTLSPEPRVVACGAVLQVLGEAAFHHRAAWVVNATGPGEAHAAIPGADLFSFGSEAELLAHFRDYVVEADADIIVGYDLNEQLGTAIARASTSGSRRCSSYGLGRLVGVASRVKNSTFESRQAGKHERKEINAEGRILFDILAVMESEQKLTSYSLPALALHFLGATRLELRAAAEERLSRERPAELARLALRDAELCLRLLEKQQCLFRYVEMARVTGVPIEYLLTRGQSVKVFSMLLRKARAHGYVLPGPARGVPADDSYEGGAVLEPSTGFYDEPIVTLDFASLYPSIMQKHNLCYSTLLTPGTPAPKLPPGPGGDDNGGCGASYEEVPGLGHRFTTARVRRGLIPMVLEELLAARAAAKKEMKLAKDPQLRAVLDGRQLALKVSANSVYGFTGMAVGTLPCKAIAASVTAYGRQMIERTKNIIEARFCRDKGCERNASVIYGDTDSVMVSLGPGCPLQDAFEFGRAAADLASQEFGAPVRLEFEKVYQPYLLMNKKRYAGLAKAGPEDRGKLDVKGIEVVRRDWCQLVRQVVDRCLHLLLHERAPEKAIAYVQETLAALRQGDVDARLLVVSKALVRSGAEDYTAKQVHVELAEKIRQRDPALAPHVGDRVPYVFVVGPAGAPAYDKSEDPLYAMEHDVAIDADYYIEHQLKQPLLRIFTPVLGSGRVAGLLSGGDQARRVVRGAAAGSGPLAAFVRPRAKCLGCRTLLQDPSGVLCSACGAPDHIGEVVERHIATMRRLEAETAGLFAECVRCEGHCCGGLHAECANVDCPIFFRKKKAVRELGAAQKAMQKLRLDW